MLIRLIQHVLKVSKKGRIQSKQRKHIKKLSWVYCATNTAGLIFLSSQNKGVILDSHSSEIFMPYAKSFIDNVFLIKMARY